eukprot:8897709-Pyramimonas_sp.AAC.1
MARMREKKHGGIITNNIHYNGNVGKGNKELSIHCRLDLPAIPPAYKTSRTKVHGAKRQSSLVHT